MLINNPYLCLGLSRPTDTYISEIAFLVSKKNSNCKKSIYYLRNKKIKKMIDKVIEGKKLSENDYNYFLAFENAYRDSNIPSPKKVASFTKLLFFDFTAGFFSNVLAFLTFGVLDASDFKKDSGFFSRDFGSFLITISILTTIVFLIIGVPIESYLLILFIVGIMFYYYFIFRLFQRLKANSCALVQLELK